MGYQYQKGPGCGGCLLLLLLFALATGGAPFLIKVIGFLAVSGLFSIFLLMALFWGITYLIRRQVVSYERSQTDSHNIFVYLLIHILVRIAQLDGSISQEEINTIRNFFKVHLHYSQNQLLWVKGLIKQAIQNSVALEALLTEFKAKFSYEPRLILLELIYQVIYSKGVVSPQELATAETISRFLDIFPHDHQTIQARYRKDEAEEERYYQILGVEPGSDWQTIKSAYRSMSMRYHPDKVGHLGEEFRKVAEDKMKEINAAYNYIKKKFAKDET